MPVSNNNFMDKLLRDVEECFKGEKNNLIEFFIGEDFDDTQSDELAFAMRRAVYYLKKDIAMTMKKSVQNSPYIIKGEKKKICLVCL